MPYKDPQKRKEYEATRRNKSGQTGKAIIFRGSSRHIALGVMKMLRRPITTADLREINPKLFAKHTGTVFQTLVAKGLAVETEPAHYKITAEGLRVLNEIPIKYPRRAD